MHWGIAADNTDIHSSDHVEVMLMHAHDIFVLMFLRTMTVFNSYIKFYFTFLVVLEKHETAPKLLCYYFKMASVACSFVPSGAREGRCMPKYGFR